MLRNGLDALDRADGRPAILLHDQRHDHAMYTILPKTSVRLSGMNYARAQSTDPSTPVRVTILGSGTSTGVPVVGCSCSVCGSRHPKNKRLRSSVLLDFADSTRVLIDVGPDFRAQALGAGIHHLDAVLFTHVHADHSHGLDDLRALSFADKGKVISCYLDPAHLDDLRERFAYAFRDTGYAGTKPQVELRPITGPALVLGAIEVDVAKLPHGGPEVLAFRFGRFAYATDFQNFPPDIVLAWRGRVDTMVASGIRYRPHPTHSTIEETLGVFDALGVRRGILTHLAHDVAFPGTLDLSQRTPFDRTPTTFVPLPPNREFAYDGMTIDLEGPVA